MAETKDKLATLSQVKRLVESQGGGGASLELLWEGTANKLTSTNIGVDLTEYSLVVFETTESSSNYSAVYPVVCPNPRVGSSYYTSHISGRYMSIDIANVSTVVLSYSYIAYLRAVYGIKASGGGVAPEPEPEPTGTILFESFGEQVSESGPLDLYGYSYIEIACHSSTATGMVERVDAPFYEAKASTPDGAFHLTQYSATTFSVDATLPAYIDTVTAYK